MIKVNNIHKKYKKREILKGVSLEIKPGEIVALIGKNGCGKSTLLKTMAGILKPDSGEISFWNTNALENKKAFEKFVGYVPQDNPLFEELSVNDNLKFWSKGVDKINTNVVQDFDLSDILNENVSSLSGGMKRRLAIACSVERCNPFMILDEPTSALDLYYQECIANWMKDFTKNNNGAILMSTHNTSEIAIADVIYLLSDGVIKQVDKDKGMDYVKSLIINS